MAQIYVLGVVHPAIGIFIILGLGLFAWWRIQVENNVAGVKPAPPQENQES